ncbi:MAG: DNA replication/repair protein RecF [Patescibacteria group bacterium]
MSFQSITLYNFRSYNEASFEFSDGVNIIIGPNAAGKTNLLEAVYVSALGRGFRSKQDSDLIRSDQKWTKIDAIVNERERLVVLEKTAQNVRLKKKFVFGGNEKKRLGFDDTIPLVLFQPDDLRLVGGSPARRRDYVDNFLSQLTPIYRQDLSAYNRVLAQRNSYLKNSREPMSDQMFVWNMQLAERGGRIIQQRLKILNMLSIKISTVYSQVAGTDHKLEIKYESAVQLDNYSNSLLQALEKSLSLDKLRGFTAIGPHRDNIVISIDGQSFKDVASRGENRTLILALKMIELEELEVARQTTPLLLLDDVFSELDGSRRSLLTSYLKNHQTLITTTDADITQKKFSKNTNTISI